jgi:hypothetical protein
MLQLLLIRLSVGSLMKPKPFSETFDRNAEWQFYYNLCQVCEKLGEATFSWLWPSSRKTASPPLGCLTRSAFLVRVAFQIILVEIHQRPLPKFSGWRNLGFYHDQAPALHHRFCNASALSRVVTSGLLHDLQDLRSWNFACQIRGWNPSVISPYFKRFFL